MNLCRHNIFLVGHIVINIRNTYTCRTFSKINMINTIRLFLFSNWKTRANKSLGARAITFSSEDYSCSLRWYTAIVDSLCTDSRQSLRTVEIKILLLDLYIRIRRNVRHVLRNTDFSIYFHRNNIWYQRETAVNICTCILLCACVLWPWKIKTSIRARCGIPWNGRWR